MKLALVRIGVDSGSGGIDGPLFEDGSFEYIPIPDNEGLDERTYGNTIGRHGGALINYFPKARHSEMTNRSIHFDPEFNSFTYGDPTPPKAGLRRLVTGDLLVFYCGLHTAGFDWESGLYLMGFFEIEMAGYARGYTSQQLEYLFSNNFHVRHPTILRRQMNQLVLVKGSPNSRLLNKAILISETSEDRNGKPLKVLSKEMRKVFGDFDGKISIQRSPTRWIKDPKIAEQAATFVRSCT